LFRRWILASFHKCGGFTARSIFTSVALALTLAYSHASAQSSLPSTTTSIGLAEALELAWQRSPAALNAPGKAREMAVRQQSNGNWLAGAPAVSLAHRTDRITGNAGLRELEAELDLPLWRAGTRSANQRLLDAESRSLAPTQQVAKLQLAGQLRDLAANIALARLDRELAQQKLNESVQLTQDITRRLRAGDVARLDAVQSQLVQAQAQAALNAAQAQLQQNLLQWQGLTGTSRLPSWSDTALPSDARAVPDNHPQLLAAQAQIDNAKARLNLAEVDRADPMDLSIGMSRERSAFGNAAERNLRLALRIPLGTNSRNAPRIAAATAELASAQNELDAQRRLLANELELAHASLSQARANEVASKQRLDLAKQMHEIVLRAYNLGERDLPARLRADSEKFDAELSFARTQLDTRRAVSKLQQQLGLLP
jgi:outer membrane protein, heavy metal efflux system